MRNLSASLNWTQDAEEMFIKLKQELAAAAELESQIAHSCFIWMSLEQNSVRTASCSREKGGGRNILMYVSVMLDNMEKRHPTCTQHAAGIAKLIQKTAHIVLAHQFHI